MAWRGGGVCWRGGGALQLAGRARERTPRNIPAKYNVSRSKYLILLSDALLRRPLPMIGNAGCLAWGKKAELNNVWGAVKHVFYTVALGFELNCHLCFDPNSITHARAAAPPGLVHTMSCHGTSGPATAERAVSCGGAFN